MSDLDLQLLDTVSAGFSFLDGCSRALDACMRHTDADAGCCLRAADTPGSYTVLATRGRLLKSGSATARLAPEHLAAGRTVEQPAGLLFQHTACAVNVVAAREPVQCLVRLEWADPARVPRARVVELREACLHLDPVLRRLQELDGRKEQIRSLRASAAPPDAAEDDLDDPRIEHLLPLAARLVADRCHAGAACVLLAEQTALILEPDSFVGIRPDILPVRIAPQADAAEIARLLFPGHASLLLKPVLVGEQPIALLVAAASGKDALDRAEIDSLRALADELRTPLWKVILHRRTRARNPLALTAVPREILEDALHVAAMDAPLLLSGEPGTEKQALAQFVHLSSDRADGPFIALNAAEIADSLAESRLFGHKKGAFTAVSDSAGAFQLAHAGTLFIDNIDHLNVGLQTKVLRAVEGGGIRPLGSHDACSVDARIICGTDADPAARGKLLQDLYLRVRVFELRLPALRARADAIPRAAAQIARELAGREVPFAERALRVLQAHDFPGNVRELRGVVQSALASARGAQVDIEALPARLLGKAGARHRSQPMFDFERSKAEFEKAYLVRLVKHARGNMTAAAELGGLDRSHLYRLLRKHGLTRGGDPK